jgi:hypothetical protein
VLVGFEQLVLGPPAQQLLADLLLGQGDHLNAAVLLLGQTNLG